MYIFKKMNGKNNNKSIENEEFIYDFLIGLSLD